MSNIKENIKEIEQQLAHSQVKIIAVTKYYGVDRLVEAYDEGLRNFGENKVVDAITKIESLSQKIRDDSIFHLIGHLQSNKVKKAVKYFDVIHSVDSLKLAQKIDAEMRKLENIKIEGLMTMAPKSMSEGGLYALFDGVKKIKFELNSKYEDSMEELSMGMSQDYLVAIKCGSTMIRLGKKIFD